MARNSEKAMAMLNRWHQMKRNIISGTKKNRPKYTEESDSIKECEYWRQQVIRDLALKISKVQNASLGETTIREINHEINKLLEEKAKWECRIKKLGGSDYTLASAKATDVIGSHFVVTTKSGYKFFGAAKELPNVQKMLEKENKSDQIWYSFLSLNYLVNPEYYGWRDEENDQLVYSEKKKETELERNFPNFKEVVKR